MASPFKQFPRGRLNAEDEGAIQVAVGVQDDVVVLAFPKLVSWVGMPAEQAASFAAARPPGRVLVGARLALWISALGLVALGATRLWRG